jgi:hypothetical protein
METIILLLSDFPVLWDRRKKKTKMIFVQFEKIFLRIRIE